MLFPLVVDCHCCVVCIFRQELGGDIIRSSDRATNNSFLAFQKSFQKRSTQEHLSVGGYIMDKEMQEIFKRAEEAGNAVRKQQQEKREKAKEIEKEKKRIKKGQKLVRKIIFLLALVFFFASWYFLDYKMDIPEDAYLIILLIGLFFPPAFLCFSLPAFLLIFFFNNLGAVLATAVILAAIIAKKKFFPTFPA